jgi:phosphinothricin acetyltransferase
VGWAAASRVSVRDVYRGVAECSVYVAADARGGVGEPLLNALVAAADDAGIWTLEAVIFVENTASRKMVEACGFRLVGRRERLGEVRGRWRDVFLMERRRPG